MTYSASLSMTIPGFIEPEELEWLYQRATKMNAIVEVGTWMGRSASALAAGCSGRVYTIDHFQGSPSELEAAHAEAKDKDIHALATANLAPYPNVTILRMDSLRASRMFRRESVDMVFLDGEHTREAVLVDLLAWTPKCRQLLCGHDRDWDGVLGALALYGLPFQAGPGSLWYMENL